MKKKTVILFLAAIMLLAAIPVFADMIMATGTKPYSATAVRHRFDTQSVLRGDNTGWLSARDVNTRLYFVSDPGVNLYQRSTVLGSNGYAASDSKIVYSGGAVLFGITKRGKGSDHLYLRIHNPHHPNSNYKLYTSGKFMATPGSAS